MIVLILVGVPGFPLIPPGPIILLGAAALVTFVRWRWIPVLEVVGLVVAIVAGAVAVSRAGSRSVAGQ